MRESFSFNKIHQTKSVTHQTMKSTIAIIILCLSIIKAESQALYSNFGVPIREELLMKTWPGDSIAEAGVISDNGVSRFFENYDNGFDIFFERTTKIKIFKEAGIKYANIEIPLYFNSNSFEKVDNIKGVVHTFENGVLQTSKLNIDQIYEEKINSNWIVKKFALPNVKVGSVIEYNYRVISPFKFNLPDWEFQWAIPVKSSSYTVGIIPFYEYMFLSQGITKFSKQTSYLNSSEQQFGSAKYKEMFYVYEMSDLLPFRDDDFITSRKDFIKKIDFQLTKFTDLHGISTKVVTTWNELSKELIQNSNFGKYISASEKNASQKMPIATSTDTLGMLKEAINHVKSQFAWDNRYQLYATKSLKDFLIQKKGNSAEINLYTIGLLNAMGIKAKPVLISTRNHGKIVSDYPFLNAFNHILIFVTCNNKPLLLDATDPYYPYDVLPIECINEKGYLIDVKNPDTWLALNNAKISEISTMLEYTLSEDKSLLQTKIMSYANNHDAAELRKSYLSDKDKFKQQIFNNQTITQFDVENIDNLNERFNIIANGETDAELVGSDIIIQPFLGFCSNQNIFKAETRDYPIDLTFNYRRNYSCTINIPDGYKIAKLPDPVKVEDPLMAINLVVLNKDNQVFITGNYQLNKAVYPAENYKQLKNLYALMIRKLNQVIILTPITTSTETTDIQK